MWLPGEFIIFFLLEEPYCTLLQGAAANMLHERAKMLSYLISSYLMVKGLKEIFGLQFHHFGAPQQSVLMLKPSAATQIKI